MFIAIIGTRFSGRTTIESYLRAKGFVPVRIRQAPEQPLWFASATELLEHVTLNWRSNFVTRDLRTERMIQMFTKRPFFMLVSVDGPISDRFRRANTNLQQYVTLHVINNFDDTLASLASMRSNCMKRRVGAILVRNKRILATGYNGTPLGLTNCNEGGCSRCNGSDECESCLCLHAEENALLETGRERVEGATLYCNTCPCLTCTVKIVQSGVKEVVYNLSYKVDDASARVFQEAGVTLRRHRPTK
ncbi:cytidine deaminase-like protein [Lactarius pseudohatsudake]|nr:cytidine deaminase-like protein [Lactarius pseudohatsudake]